MPNSPIYSSGLLDEFRRHIGDTSYSYVQLEVLCDGESVTQALVEVSDNTFMTDLTGGGDNLTFDLAESAYATVELLAKAIWETEGYRARVSEDGEGIHRTSDFEVIPPKDCLNKWVQLKTRRWSDEELTDVLNQAVGRLGRDLTQTYDLVTVPSAVKDLLFLLGKLGVYWDQINNATKRRGLDLSVEDFRTLHGALLDEYERALKAYLLSLEKVTPETIADLGSGDVIVGTLFRRNWRTGRMVPSALSPYPQEGAILATYIGAGKIRLDWTRARETNFYSYDVWRGTTNAVSNASEVVRPSGSISATGTKIVREFDQARTLWVDGGTSPLPAGTYFYRLYIFNLNGEFTGSTVAQATVPA